MLMTAAREERRVGDVDRKLSANTCRCDQLGRGAHPRRREQIDGADLILLAEHAPRRTLGGVFAKGKLSLRPALGDRKQMKRMVAEVEKIEGERAAARGRVAKRPAPALTGGAR